MLGEAANAPWRSAVPLLGDVRPTVNAIREEANSFRLLTLRFERACSLEEFAQPFRGSGATRGNGTSEEPESFQKLNLFSASKN